MSRNHLIMFPAQAHGRPVHTNPTVYLVALLTSLLAVVLGVSSLQTRSTLPSRANCSGSISLVKLLKHSTI